MKRENKGRRVKQEKEKQKEKIKENKNCINTFQAKQTLRLVFSSSTQQSEQTVALSLCCRPQLCTSTNSQNWTRKGMSHGVGDNTMCSTWPPHHDVYAAGNHYSRKNQNIFHLLFLLFPNRLTTYSSSYSSAKPNHKYRSVSAVHCHKVSHHCSISLTFSTVRLMTS